MKKVMVLLLVMLTMTVFAGTASAKARGMIVWGEHPACQNGQGQNSNCATQ